MLDFSIYTEIAKWTGWPAIAAILLLAITAIIFLYDQRLKIHEQEKTRLKKEIEDIKNYSADQLIFRLKERHKMAMEELDKLVDEKRRTEEEILLKQKELENLKAEKSASDLSNKDRIEKMEALIKVLKNDYEQAKKMAVNKQIELEAAIKAATDVLEMYRK